ncbi:hypothetical protein LVJ94_47820 [Pendulispora rubella]|uniref:Beta-ketoacyl synthase N-terminal domain-containing protein n=1 Tax=Pendulispora rubella TaxID=2741070 RepID=A0ABZ2L4U5_9BACT
MTPRVLCVGMAGTLPEGSPFADLAARAVEGGEAPALSPMLRRERKVRILVEAVHRALGPIRHQPDALRRCGFVLATRWDGRPANLLDADTGRVVSFGDLSPSTVALSLVPHVAASCVLTLYKLRGPALSLASRDGLAAAWRIAQRWLVKARDPVLVVESELAMPSTTGQEVAADYALAVLLSHPEYALNQDMDAEGRHDSVG